MNWKKLGLALVFLDFVALTGWALFTEPPAVLIDNHTTSLWGAQVFLDLVFACGFGVAWMWRDARERGLNPLPWALAVPFTGSLALFVYALWRPSEAPSTERGLARAPA